MIDLFTSPWTMAAGAALVSVPIIIHLINRIRYQRVRWAAMEFLLKAQKRMRRKLIIQQLLLLALRCFIIFLLGLLVARFIGFQMTGDENRPTAHLALLDDTPSMTDGWRTEEGANTDSFEEAKRMLTEQVAKSASEAPTQQTLEVLRLSDLGTPRNFERLNSQSLEDLRNFLSPVKPTKVRVPLIEGLRRARDLFASRGGDINKVLHVFGDFRRVDWADDAEAIKEVIAELNAAKVKVYLLDVVHPFRKTDQREAPLSRENLSIVELSPARLVAARNDPLEVTLRVQNNGSATVNNVRISVRVNGDENRGGRSVIIPTLPGKQERVLKFEVTLDRVGTDDKPLDRFNLITASIESGENGGLTVDNVRHAVVEVRDRLPILIIEGRPELREAKDGDGFYLRPVFTQVLGGYGWVNGTARDLEQLDLSRFSFVLLLNVPSLTEPAIKRLETFVRSGGGAGFFLGPNVNAKEYNDKLYRGGAGLFPVSLMDQPSRELNEDELQARRFRISQKKILLRDPSRRNHPALAGLYTDERGEPVKDAEQLERVFGFLSIKRYWPLTRPGKWRDDRSVTELYCMPNEQPMADFEKAIRDVADGLPVDDVAMAKFKDPLSKARAELRTLAVSSDPLYRLAVALDGLLADQRGEGDPNEALLREFWTLPSSSELRAQVSRLRDAVKFGDPFYLARDFGRGRVTLITTTAGETWTDWPSEKPGSASYTPILKEMGNYLAGAGADRNRLLGQPLEVVVEANRYKPVVGRTFITCDPLQGNAGAPGATEVTTTDLKEQSMVAEGERLTLRFTEAVQPGGYLFTLTDLKPPAAPGAEMGEVAEYRGFAANLDAEREGNLRRASNDEVTSAAPGAQLHSADDSTWLKELRNKPSDLSESVWLFLVLLGLLLLEQWLSMKMGYHSAPTSGASATIARPGRVAEPVLESTTAV